MTPQQERAFRSWDKFLNPELLKGNLIGASLFLAAYELLRSSIIDQLRDFYCLGFNEKGDIISPNYSKKVLSLAKSPLRASLLWLQEAQVLNDVDVEQVQRIRTHRNQLAHKLVRHITSVEAEIDVDLFAPMIELVAKIDVWWIRNVELDINPDFDGKEIPDSEIHSCRMICLQLMIHLALGKDSARFYDDFVKQATEAPDQPQKSSRCARP
jgi:hypothetical protein